VLIDLNNYAINNTEIREIDREDNICIWVDLGYRLRSRDKISLQGSGG